MNESRGGGDGSTDHTAREFEMDDRSVHDDEDRGPIGIFPSWKALYWSVVIYVLVLIGVLWAFTVAFDHSAG